MVDDGSFRIVFAGGGTGGHLFPAIAIADEIKRESQDAEITFIGTKERIEARVVPAHGYHFEPIVVSGFRRRLTLRNLLFPFKVLVGLVQSFILMRKLRPDVVVGTGGYVCGPPLYAASILGIPTVIQEQNSYPGVTTRLLARRATEVHLTFESSKKYFPRQNNLHVSGNPTRSIVGTITREEGVRRFGLDPERKTLLVFGGSLGATSINNAMMRILPELVDTMQVLWQTGESDYERISTAVSTSPSGMVKVFKFIEQMEFAYAACDLAVCRAGATTVAELARAGVPAILVPYPYAAADHQTENARALVEAGAAVLIADHDLQTRLRDTVNTLMRNAERRSGMVDRARSLVQGDAARIIAQAILRLIKN